MFLDRPVISLKTEGGVLALFWLKFLIFMSQGSSSYRPNGFSVRQTATKKKLIPIIKPRSPSQMHLKVFKSVFTLNFHPFFVAFIC